MLTVVFTVNPLADESTTSAIMAGAAMQKTAASINLSLTDLCFEDLCFEDLCFVDPCFVDLCFVDLCFMARSCSLQAQTSGPQELDCNL
jgi:hypothetical protein